MSPLPADWIVVAWALEIVKFELAYVDHMPGFEAAISISPL